MSETNPEAPAPRVDYALHALRALCVVGLAFSSMLLFDYLRPPVFCSDAAASGCEVVKHSRFARPLGVPLPVPGLIYFAGMVALSFLRGPRARRWLTLGATLGALAGVSFLTIQGAVLHAWCKLCLVVDTSAVLIGVAALLRKRDDDDAPAERWSGVALPLTAGLSLLAVVAPLSLGFLSAPPPAPPARPQVAETLPAPIEREQRPGVATIVEFVDFECPFCRREAEVLSSVLPAYGDRVRVVRKNVPLSFHEHARGAARAECCAEEQGRGDRVADALFRATDLSPEGCERVVREAGADMEAWRACMASRRPDVALERDHDDARASGVQALPTLFIGHERFEGFQEAEVLRASIDRAIARAGATPRG